MTTPDSSARPPMTDPHAGARAPLRDPQYEEWVHATNASEARGVFGWRDDRSPTGFLSGIVVDRDHRALRVLVRDIRPGVIKR